MHEIGIGGSVPICWANEPPPCELSMSQVLRCWTPSGVARWQCEPPGALPRADEGLPRWGGRPAAGRVPTALSPERAAIRKPRATPWARAPQNRPGTVRVQQGRTWVKISLAKEGHRGRHSPRERRPSSSRSADSAWFIGSAQRQAVRAPVIESPLPRRDGSPRSRLRARARTGLRAKPALRVESRQLIVDSLTGRDGWGTGALERRTYRGGIATSTR
jgi:hypothetical protein